ncbi:MULTISPECIES: prolyl aminopeptidase [Hyphobacterium]|uniref:Proline iminopeptidase n=1 Tax=Hyphobacterium vulgare TaxID=1736751 RepID=A0ABV7A0E2_9PROT
MDQARRGVRRPLYPAVTPYSTRQLPVGDGHSLHVEECGRADGLPIVILHGGPGGGASPVLRRFADPKHYRAVLFDQRGCGRSVPHAALHANTTQDLVDDMERIREALGIDRWVVLGGSWGTTLALAYARTHPDRVLGLILRGVFLCTQAELDWFYRDGTNALFPEQWEALVTRLLPSERDDIVSAYHERLQAGTRDARAEDARAWARYESALVSLLPTSPPEPRDPLRDDAIARLETHYFVNKGFFAEDGELLRDVPRFAHIPGVIIQGRYDVITPARTGWSLARAWGSKAKFEVIGDAGHSTGEPGVADAIIRAADTFARQFS